MAAVSSTETTVQTIQRIIRRDLKLGDSAALSEHMPLVGGDLDLDSLDVLLMLTSLEKEFGFKITSETIDRSAFATVRTLADYVDRRRAESAAAVPAPEPRLDLSQLLGKLPHGEPFRFVTELTQVKPGVSARGLWRVRGDEPFFAGHFPGRPLVPGVLLAEALAQVSGLLVAAAEGLQEGRLASFDVRFLRAVAPPAEIELYSQAAGGVGGLRQFEVEARAAGDVIAQGSVALSMSAGK